MAELWGRAGGANRKFRELHGASGGANRKLKEMWARDQSAVNRKIFSSVSISVSDITLHIDSDYSSVKLSSLSNYSMDSTGFHCLVIASRGSGVGQMEECTLVVRVPFVFSEPITFYPNKPCLRLNSALTATNSPYGSYDRHYCPTDMSISFEMGSSSWGADFSGSSAIFTPQTMVTSDLSQPSTVSDSYIIIRAYQPRRTHDNDDDSESNFSLTIPNGAFTILYGPDGADECPLNFS